MASRVVHGGHVCADIAANLFFPRNSVSLHNTNCKEFAGTTLKNDDKLTHYQKIEYLGGSRKGFSSCFFDHPTKKIQTLTFDPPG